MAKKRERTYHPGKYYIYIFIIFCILLPSLSGITGGHNTTYAAGDAKVQEINLNLEGEIAGITNPKEAADASSEWEGSYIYFGYYYDKTSWLPWDDEKSPVKWRVLDADTTAFGTAEEPTILLFADQVLGKVEFNHNAYEVGGESYVGTAGNQHNANEYAYSNIRKWLNSEEYDSYEKSDKFKGGFYNDAFSPAEQTGIAVSAKNAEGNISGYYDNNGLSENGTADKVFLLGIAEVLNPKYGFYNKDSENGIESRTLDAASYAKKYGVKQEEGEGAAWWLRSAFPDSGKSAYAINEKGRIGKVNVAAESGVGAAPAVNIKLSSVAFTYRSDKTKSGEFDITSDAQGNKEWKLTLWGGNNFSASFKKEGDRTVHISVDRLGTQKQGVNYNQLSAILVNDAGTVLCYGKISKGKELTAGKIEIPKEIPAGTYTLKIFAEEVNDGQHTDFASNMVDFSVRVSGTGITINNPTPIPTPTLTPTPTPTPSPTMTPTPRPTSPPALKPTPTLTQEPTKTPTPAPTQESTRTPELTSTPPPEKVPAAESPLTPEPALAEATKALKPAEKAEDGDENTETNTNSDGWIYFIAFIVFIILAASAGGFCSHFYGRKKNK